MDDFCVKLNNLENLFIQENKQIPIVKANGYPLMLLAKTTSLTSINEGVQGSKVTTYYFSEIKL